MYSLIIPAMFRQTRGFRMRIYSAFLLAALSCTSCTALGGGPVELSTLNEVYERSQPVNLIITNASSQRVRVYSNLEVLDEEQKWVTWHFRAEDGMLDSVANIYPLKPGASTTTSFDIRKIALPLIPEGKHAKLAEKVKFRFRVVVLGARGDGDRVEMFSDPFVILYPYGKANR